MTKIVSLTKSILECTEHEDPSISLLNKFCKVANPNGVYYSEDLAAEICAHVASNKSLMSYCQDKFGKKLPGRPSVVSVYRWLAQYPAFKDLYQVAIHDRAHSLAEQTIEIADDPTIDPKQARNMIDTRKWYASRLMPEKFGDRMAITGAKDAPPLTVGKSVSNLSDEELQAIAQGVAMAQIG